MIFEGEFKWTLCTSCLCLSSTGLIEDTGAHDHRSRRIEFILLCCAFDGHFAFLVKIEGSIHLFHASLVEVSEFWPLSCQG